MDGQMDRNALTESVVLKLIFTTSTVLVKKKKNVSHRLNFKCSSSTFK